MAFLHDPIHDSYRNHGVPSVQVDGSFSFSNTIITVNTIFTVLPLSKIPNQRSGIILGQHAFMNYIRFEAIPRTILVAKGELVEEEVWGDIVVKEVIEGG